MGYRPKQAQLRNNNIVDPKDFDQEYDSLKAELNGNIDRQNIKAGSVEPKLCKAKAFYSYYDVYTKINEDEIIDGIGNSASAPFSDVPGISYGKYSGGWNKTKLDLTFDAIEGSLLLEFGCYAFNNVQLGGGKFAGGGGIPKSGIWLAFQIVYNGNVVAEIDRQYRPFFNPRMSCVIPVATEKAKVSIRWRATARNNNTVTHPLSNAPMAFWSGGRLTAINKYR
jgi:hypothetical protein